jgi:serine/threonine protein kinase
VASLGSGTLGPVYHVVHRELGRHFVLKAFDAAGTDHGELVRSLRAQWRALAELEHPSFVAVTDAGSTEAGVPFVVMEWLEGETLETRLGRPPGLTVAEALDVALGISRGLEAAHGIGIVHGAIKPSNVFLAGATIKLLDSGLGPMAAVLRAPRGPGTGRYSAPEQAAGGRIDARTDLFSLGVVLFEMLAGVHPFGAGGDQTEAEVSRLGPPATRLTAVLADADSTLEALVGSLLERDARGRPESARAVVQALAVVAERYRTGRRFESAPVLSELTERDALGGEVLPASAAFSEATRRDARFAGDTVPDGLDDRLRDETIVEGAPATADSCPGSGAPRSEQSTARVPLSASAAVDSTQVTVKTSVLAAESSSFAEAGITTVHDKTAPLPEADREMPVSADDPGPTRTAAGPRRVPEESSPPASGSELPSRTRAGAERPGMAKWLIGFGVAAVAVVALTTAWLSRSPARNKAAGHLAPAGARAPAPASTVAALPSDASAPALVRASASAEDAGPAPAATRPAAPDTSKRRARRPRTHARPSTQRPKKPTEAPGASSTPAGQTGHVRPVLPGSGL